ncbi:IS4 family transposase [Alicyclobacillus dauci]|uniref:IS4 family transposase n=1 Tax=Alicyclobacillus dauci TaxID=1475485 RepID=A0ABY6Z5Y8_9BACL|nr:IS4 family transposase [Alicyclobacillus dauci]WAH38280.1 IS4 family transposase [Alicyclobacillus dauci]WAH39505.1 IS4 family transposase [Alicyclobacillus dauci]WAH39565.1 IS4 family transposase [Alicyclobacillus dauci]
MDKDSTKSVFAEYVLPLNVSSILQELDHLKLDRYVKKLGVIPFIRLIVFAQVNQIPSLTDISLELEANESLQKELALDSISASQLSRKLRETPSTFLDFVFRQCVEQITRQVGIKRANEKLRRINLVDSSTISMCLSQYPWAEFRRTKAGVKLHLRLVFLDHQVAPDKVILTPAKPADKTQMDALVVVEPDALNVFDRGYVDYRKFDAYCANKTKFVTRLKDNAVIHEVIEERTVPDDSPVTREALVRLGSYPNYVMKYTLRLIETTDSEGKRVVILTNDMAMDAEQICDVYRKRWQIELFFKWVKQHLVLKRLYGKSENAVYNQLLIALITYCLLILIQAKVSHNGKLLDVYKCLRLYWERSFSEFVKALYKSPGRTSKGRRRCKVDNIFEQTVRQYIDGETEHLETVTYDLI